MMQVLMLSSLRTLREDGDMATSQRDGQGSSRGRSPQGMSFHFENLQPSSLVVGESVRVV